MSIIETEMRDALKRIENEIVNLDGELECIKESVEKDLDSLLLEYRQKINNTNLSEESLKNKYRGTLITKRKEAIEKAKIKLIELKTEISNVFKIEKTNSDLGLNTV